MKTVTFTEIEIRVLKALLDNNSCESGCAFSEMQDSNIPCWKCPFVKAVVGIKNKLELI